MSTSIPPNTQAILLLTAPLIAGRREPSSELLTPGEYNLLARTLRDKQRQPADLLGLEASVLVKACESAIDTPRLERLLGRGFLLSQAIERWQTRAIWVVSRAEPNYPKRLKTRLKEQTPPILYGCGDAAILDTGGLAIVGSRNVDDALVDYAENIGRLTAQARRTVVSGGARGIDQAAMRGALEAGGSVTGVMADGLETAALARDHREFLMGGRLVLISPYDPAAGFNVGHAMQRNKLIYALADAGLVVSSDYEKGGTWAGAIEQLEKLRLVPMYARSNGEMEKGLEALRRRGALPWPNPVTPEEFAKVLAMQVHQQRDTPDQGQISFSTAKEPTREYEVPQEAAKAGAPPLSAAAAPPTTPAEELFAKVRSLLEQMNTPKTDAEVAGELNVSKSQAKEWLKRLVEEGVLEKLSKPTRYRSPAAAGRLF
jgi:predicted Rossmann fold nucleotide-binding protein DprA/Smf involved in DNA uptake